jgi:hypothetical protein
MILKTSSSDKIKIYNKTAIQIVASVTFSLTVLTVNAGEAAISTEEATPSTGAQSESSTSPTRKPRNFLKGDAATGSFLNNNTAIIQGTDFSREIGFSGQGQSLEQVGFTKKIVLTTSLVHDSNPALDDNLGRAVWIYSLAPQVLLDYTGEENNLYLDAALQMQRNSNEEVLADRDDPRLAMGWSRTYEAGIYGVYANYSQFVSRAAEITATGEFAGNLDGESTQRNRTFGGRWQHALASRWSVLTSGEYVKTSFSGGVVGIVDFGLVDVRSRLNYEFTDRLDTYLQLGYSKITPDDTFEATKLGRFALGANYLLSEGLTIASRAGMYRTTGAQSETDWEAGVQLGYDVGRMRYVAELNREVAGSAIGAFQKSDTFRLGWLFDKSEIDSFRVNYSLIKFREDDAGLLPELQIQEISALYDRTLGGKWRGQANVAYRDQSRTGFHSDGTLVGVTLIYDGLSF